MPGGFHAIDWAVLGVYLLGTSWLAERLAGRKQTLRDYFLGGKQLPWPAVAGSIVASEISGVTFVSVPAVAFAAGGDYTLLMLSLGYLLARVVIAGVFVPAYYRHEVYSPYEFLGRRIGADAERLASGLFFLGGFLAQGARLYLAALVLDSITGLGLAASLAVLGAVSVVWTWAGGVTSVVWTDVVQCAILVVGGIAALVAVLVVVPGGWSGIVEAGREAGKFRVLNLSADPRAEYTLWAGLFGAVFLTMASHGTDQMMAQRIFCCRGVAEAKKAVLWSGLSQLLPVLMLTVGVGIYAYFKAFPMNEVEAAFYGKGRDYLLPLFILKAMPVGVKGLLYAAIFSAATATSTLSAMAQTAMSAFVLPGRAGTDEAKLVRISKAFVLLAGVGLCVTAWLCSLIQQYREILNLALAMAGYTYGALLGMLFVALLPGRRDARGLRWGVPLSVLLVFALNWQHAPWGRAVVGAGVAALLLGAFVALRRESRALAVVSIAGALVLAAAFVPAGRGPDGGPLWFKLAFPWHYPLGTALTFALGVLAGRKEDGSGNGAPVSSGPT
jgi:SSS family transporter